MEDVAAQFDATVQTHVTSQGIPQVQVVERIQEPNVGPIEVLLHERVQQFTTGQIEHMPVSQTQKESAVTDAVEIVDSLSVSEEVATLTDMTTHNTSSTSISRDRLDHLEGMLDSCIEQLTPLAALGESIEKETEKISMLTKRMMETASPAPSLVEPPLAASADRTSAKRRRRTRYTSLPGILEHAVCQAPSAWPPVRHA